MYYTVWLNKSFRSDLQWWTCFLPTWNGVGMMSGIVPARYVGTITLDVSGSWGCGAFESSGEWFQLKLPESWSSIHITVKELLPIVTGIALWGRKWHGQTVHCLCDNAAVVAIIKSGRCKDERVMHLMRSHERVMHLVRSHERIMHLMRSHERVMHLMRSLFFFLALYNMVVVGEHIPGVDALSRDDVPSFLLQAPGARRQPREIPEELLKCLVEEQADWTSQSWIGSFFSKGLAESTQRSRPETLLGIM